MLHDEVTPVYLNEARKGLTENQQKIRKNQDPVTISKANKRSTVHRRVPLDVIAVKVGELVPPAGHVQILFFTDRQYQLTQSFHGRARSGPEQKKPDQLTLF